KRMKNALFAQSILPEKREHGMNTHVRFAWLRTTTFALVISLFALLLGVDCASAQSIAELSAYTAADRTQRLIDGARREGALMIYSSMTVPDMGAIIAAFTAKYGVKAQHWRGSVEEIPNPGTRRYARNRADPAPPPTP